MKKYVVLLSACLSFPLLANSLNLTYDSFYRHMTKIDQEDMDKLTMGFGFTQQTSAQICQLEEVIVDTPKLDIPIAIDMLQRFELPQERALKQAKAQVNIQFNTENVADCFISIQLRVKSQYYRKQLLADDLNIYLSQFDDFFSSAGSFFSFLLPKPTGLVIQFKERDTVVKGLGQLNGDGVGDEKHQIFLSRKWLDTNQNNLRFEEQPVAIFARMPK
jgi:hypothetical protein